MSPKNAIKIINIQKFYLVHFGLILSILSTLVLLVNSVQIGPILSTSILFCPFCHFGPNLSIHSYSVHISPPWSYTVHSFLFGPHRSPSILFDPNWSLWFYSVLIDLIRSTSFNWSNSVHYCPLRSYSVYSFLFGPFRLIQSTLILFNPFGSIQSTLVQFGLFYSILSNSFHFCPFFSNSINYTNPYLLFIYYNHFFLMI